MKKIVLSIVSLLYLLYGLAVPRVHAQPDCDGIPPKPFPPRAVNDFENLLSSSDRQRLEEKLTNYWQTTEVAIVIVTTDNFGNDATVEDYATHLYNCWGIGKQGTNFGLLIMYSKEKRKIRIATGYGTEGIITDAIARIICKSVEPFGPKGLYTAAIDSAVSKCMLVLGPESGEIRRASIAAEEEASRARWAMFKDIALSLTGIGLVAWGIIFLVGKFKAARKTALIRQHVYEAAGQMETAISNGRKLIAQSKESFQSLAAWAQKEAQAHIELAEQNLSRAAEYVETAKTNAQEDPQAADRLLSQAHPLIEKASGSFIKAEKDLKGKIQKFLDQTPLLYNQAQERIEKNLKETRKLVEQGYRFNEALQRQQDFKKALLAYDGKLNDIEQLPRIYSDCKALIAKSDDLIVNLRYILTVKQHVDDELPAVLKGAHQAVSAANVCQQVLNNCKNKYPESVWKSSETSLRSLIGKLQLDKVAAYEKTIKDLNLQNEVRLAEAGDMFNELRDQVNQLTGVIRSINSIESAQEKAKAQYPQLFSNAEEAVNRALNKIKDSDVSGHTKSQAKEAARQLDHVRLNNSNTLIDYVELLVQLNSIAEMARTALSQAENDINNAEEEREEKREEEERRRRKQRDDDSSFSSSYSSPSFGSSGSDFGGFSGGSTGGSGATGSW